MYRIFALVDIAMHEHSAIIDALDTESDPATRLRKIFAVALSDGHGPAVELRLLSARTNAHVNEAVARVTILQIDYVTDQLVSLGLDPVDARKRATLAYACYLGTLQLAESSGSVLPGTPGEKTAYIDTVMNVFGPLDQRNSTW